MKNHPMAPSQVPRVTLAPSQVLAAARLAEAGRVGGFGGEQRLEIHHNVDPGFINPCFLNMGVVPSKSDKSPLNPGTPPY